MTMSHFSVGPVLEESVSSTTATPSRNLGDRCVYQGEEYVYVYNAGGAAIGTNLVCNFITGATGYSVAATGLTDVFNAAVGVTKNTSIANASYGWVMTKGWANVTPTSALTSAGAQTVLALGAAGQVIQWAATGPTQGVAIGFALGTNASAAVSGMSAFIKTGV